LIDTNQELKKFFTEIKDCDWIALDTEFLRVNTYYPVLCVLQIATEKKSVCIDILAITDTALFDTLYRKNLTWVIHSPRQDIEVLYNLTGKLPYKIFDTQTAAFFLNLGSQISYKTLVEKYCQVELEKAHSRFDWSIRPIPQSALNYALDDVIYLAKLYPLINQELITNNFLNWFEEDCNSLLDEKFYKIDLTTVWQKVKIPNKKISQDTFTNIIYLSIYREQKAKTKNKPKTWILKDIDMFNIAQNLDNFKDKEIIKKIKQDYPELKNILQPKNKHQPLTPAQKAKKKELQTLIEIKANAYNLPSEILITNKTINTFVQNITEQLAYGWRNEVLQ
jgi:ribonuclease D